MPIDPRQYKTYGKNRSLRLKGFDYSDPNYDYFITITTQDKKSYFKNPKIAEMTLEILFDIFKKRFTAKLYVYCLMPDHLQCLMSPSDKIKVTVSRIFQAFKSLSTNEIRKKFGIKEKIWQRGFYDCIVRNYDDFIRITEYILSDPKRSGLVDNADDYPYRGKIDPLPL